MLTLTTLPSSIVEEYGKMVSAICFKMLQNRETANEAAQEAWVEVVKSYHLFDNRSKISTWIYTITYRVVMRYAANERLYSTRFLKSYVHGENREPPLEMDYDHQLWVKEMCDQCLTGILHCLDNEARIAYMFRDVAQLPYPEIAVILAKEELSVRQIISRSRRKLKNFLKNECLLYNPNGSCQCRMRKMVEKVNLLAEYEKLDAFVNQINFFRQSEIILPGKNYWEKYL
jgi:RNA polymerase sigma factor (sigma-70 family)